MNMDSEIAAIGSRLRKVVCSAFREVLGRDPESDEVIERFVALGSEQVIWEAISGSPEATARTEFNLSSSFYHCASMFDAEATIRRHAKSDLAPDPGHLTNFLGVKTEEVFYPNLLDGMAGTVEPIPIPANWHVDIAEWAAALRAVDLARHTFVVAELGCGSGCWINNTGVAARSAGLVPTLIGVEGDEGHITFAKRACTTNGFSPEQVQLHRGIARRGCTVSPSG